jgi:exopolysaccharide biosynthesis protein
MKKVAAFFLGVLCATSLRADWKLESTEHVATASPLITHERKTVSNGRSVELHLVFFNAKKCTFKVIDNPRQESDLASAMQSARCLAGVNGNYFHPDRTSLGLVVSDGATIHTLERARLLSGILAVADGHIALQRIAEFKPGEKLRQALQCGPFLIDHGKPVPGLNATAVATRTVVLGNGRDVWALLICEPVTLAEMAEILSTQGIFSELKIDRALNLDGGSSTGMWVNAVPQPFYRREFKSVRNYLGVVPR